MSLMTVYNPETYIIFFLLIYINKLIDLICILLFIKSIKFLITIELFFD